MQLTVLGKSPSWVDAGGACSGYLVREGDTTLLLDCGNGVFGKLRRVCDYVDVDAIVLSHLHADHVLDVVPYAYALTYAPRQQPVPVHTWPGTATPARPVLHAPPGARRFFRRLAGTWGNDDLIERAFDVREYEPAEPIGLGPLRMRFCRVPHWVPTWAVELTSAASPGRLVYGADCSPNAGIVDFARGCDLLLLEATLPRPERDGGRGHLTAREAGEHARAAGARRLVVTHVSDELGERWPREQAEAAFGATVELAREGATYVV